MKRLLILSTILLGGIVAVKAPPTLQGPTLSGSGGGLTSNQVYQIAVTVGGPTSGVPASVVASIAATNVSQGNALGATNIYGNMQLISMGQRPWNDLTVNALATPRLNYLKSRGDCIRLLVFCDDAAVGPQAQMHRIIQTNLLQTMTRAGSVTLSPNYCYLQGDGAGYTTYLGDGTQWFCQSGFLGISSSTESFTNQTDLNEAIPTRFLTVNCAKLNGGGTYTVSTQSLVNGVYGTKGTAFSFSADNGGAAAGFVTNFYLGGEFNVIASIQSSGGTTNILQSLGQWTTNANSFVYDMWDIAGMSWLTAMTNALQSNFIAQVVSNYDAVIISDLGWPYLAAPYAATMWRDNFLNADLIYTYQPPGTNLTYQANLQAKTNYSVIGDLGAPLIDLGAPYLASLYSAVSNNVAVQPLYQSDGVHVTLEGGRISGQIITDKLGLNADQLKGFGYAQRSVAAESYSVTAHDGLLVSSGAIAASPLPAFLGPIYTSYGSRFIAGHLIPTSTRQVAVAIPSNKMVGKKTLAITQYFFTTNNQNVAASFKVYRIGCNPTTYAADSGSSDVTSLQTATSNVVFAISATNTFTYAGKPGEVYNALFGYGFSSSPTNGLWWLGADILMY